MRTIWVKRRHRMRLAIRGFEPLWLGVGCMIQMLGVGISDGAQEGV